MDVTPDPRFIASIRAVNVGIGGTQTIIVDGQRIEVPSRDDLLAYATAERDDLVVIDTLSRVTEGPENDSDTYRNLYRHTWLPLKRAGIAAVRLDHTGHEGTRARGSSAKGDDVDVVWLLKPTDKDFGWKLTLAAARMGWVPESVSIEKVRGKALTFQRVSKGWLPGVAS